MKDWQAYVREQLGELNVSPARESEIVAELALQLEQAANAALARGASSAEAEAAAIKQFPNWRALAEEIRSCRTSVFADRRSRAIDFRWHSSRLEARAAFVAPESGVRVARDLHAGVWHRRKQRDFHDR